MRPDELLKTAALMRETAKSLRGIAGSDLAWTTLAYMREGRPRTAPALPADRFNETAALLDDFAETLEALAKR